MADKYEQMSADELYKFAEELYAAEDDEEKDLEEIAELMKMAADKGSAIAQCDYGVFLVNGEGVEKDEKTALEYWKKSAENNFAPALHKVAVCYLQGYCGEEKDEKKAFDYFMRAAEGGVKDSMFNVALFYQNGVGTEPDVNKAFEWIKKAAEAEQPQACYLLAMHYMTGTNGLPVDKEKSIALLTTAAESGFPEAQCTLGSCYETGSGVEKDLAEAAGWYRRSARAGLQQANESLKRLGFPGVM